jgi:hypothetical protein
MLNDMLGALLIAWILAQFGFDQFSLKVVNDVFKTSYTWQYYYLGFAIIGFLGYLLRK